ncbi:MAG: Ig-like domain-containing protein [Anaerolineae bacterium]
MQAVDGSVLQEDVSWSFSVARPSVTEVTPMAMSTAVTLDSTVQVRFNQPMNRSSVEQAFALLAEGDDTPVSGTFEWADDSMGFRFTPNALLALNTVYDISIYDEVAEGAAGGSLSAPLFSTFSTVPLPAIISTDPADGTEGAYFYGSFTLYFASPMDAETLNDKITIDPAGDRTRLLLL